MTALIIIVIAILLIVFFCVIPTNSNSADINYIKQETNNVNKQETTVKKIEQECSFATDLDKKKKEFISLYGNITKEIEITKFDVHGSFIYNRLENFIFIFEESRKIFIQNKLLDFRQILGVNYIVHRAEIEQDFSSTSTSSQGIKTKDVLKRGIIGGIIAGPIGAVIGGATAKPRRSYKDQALDIQIELLKMKERERLNYITIEITIDDLTAPIISINLNTTTNKTKDILSVLQVITSRNTLINHP